MRRILIAFVVVFVAGGFVAEDALAISKQYMPKRTGEQKFEAAEKEIEKAEERGYEEDKPASEFPEKGWHKGPYVAVHGGMIQADDDRNIQTNVKFDGTFNPSFGLTFGWDINDWLGPMLQLTYSTATATVGNGTVDYPVENARQHIMNISVFARAVIPYFTKAKWQPKNVKILPYVKLGGTGYGMYVSVNTDGNKVGSYGGGVGVGAGVEFYIWKGLFFAIDATENFLFLKSTFRTVNGVSTKITNGGFYAQFNLLGLLGWHF